MERLEIGIAAIFAVYAGDLTEIGTAGAGALEDKGIG